VVPLVCKIHCDEATVERRMLNSAEKVILI
jgi:hypothetical protein